MLLGYIEQNQIYNAINFSTVSHGDSANNGDMCQVTAITTTLNTLLCPSSPPVPGTYYGKQKPGNNYFASVGSSLWWVGANGASAPNGIFMYAGGGPLDPGNSAPPIKIASVTDGTSNTIAWGEWRTGDFDSSKLSIPQDVISHAGDPPGITGDGWGGTPLSNMPAGGPGFVQWLNTCAGLAPGSILGTDSWKTNMSYLGQAWNQGMFGWTLGNTLLAPNPRFPNCRMCSWDGDWDCPGMFGLSSYHPGGGNVAMADGSVRFLKSSTDMRTVWYLGSRNQNEVVDANSY
jgi:prepilin-type processing-associated H-X9-DG protein